MEHLDFGDNDEDAVREMKGAMNRLMHDAYGNGEPGYFKIIDRQTAVDAYRHKSNTVRLNIIIALSALATAIITAIGIYIAAVTAHHAKVLPPAIFHSESPSFALSSNRPQEASTPPPE